MSSLLRGTSRHRAIGGAAAAALGLTLLAGCTAAEQEIESPYKTQFDLALQQATTDLERKILEDYVITRDEYLEVKNLTIACIRSYGLIAELQDTGLGMFQMMVGGSWDEELVDEAVENCESKGFIAIESLYVATLTNPQNRNLDDLKAECLVAVGFVTAPFTGADYRAASSDAGFTAQLMDDAEGAKCEQNPGYHHLSGTG